MAKSVCRAADRFRTARMFGPRHRVERKVVAPDPGNVFCLLPAFENTFGAGQGRSRIESSGETRTRTRRGDSSGRRTSPSLPAPGCLVIVRRCRYCRQITASKYLALVLRTKADCLRAKTRFLLAKNSSLHSPLCDLGHIASLLQRSLDPRSATPAEGDRVRTRFSVMTGTNPKSWAPRILHGIPPESAQSYYSMIGTVTKTILPSSVML
jgi:hypothetical protein